MAAKKRELVPAPQCVCVICILKKSRAGEVDSESGPLNHRIPGAAAAAA